MASFNSTSAAGIAHELGERLKSVRLNKDMTQQEVADQAGVSRKTVLNAEKGKVQLENLVAIMQALQLTAQLDRFLPLPGLSPMQLAKLQGKQRQRASGQGRTEDSESEREAEW